MNLEAVQHLVGQLDGSQRVFAADFGARDAARGIDEVGELKREGLEGLWLDLVDSQDLAEEMFAHGSWLAQVDAVQIELAAS